MSKFTKLQQTDGKVKLSEKEKLVSSPLLDNKLTRPKVNKNGKSTCGCKCGS